MWLIAAGIAVAAPTPQLLAEYERYPEDYATAVAVARAALPSDPELAVEAWERAAALSGGNLETEQGRVAALVSAGRWSEAEEVARAAAEAYPELADPALSVGWALRFRPSPPGLGVLGASSAYRHAIELDPEQADGWCGLGWMRSARGERSGARAAFAQADALEPGGCGAEGLEAHPVGWTTRLSLSGYALGYDGHPLYTEAAGGSLQGGVAYDGRTWADLTLRGAALGGNVPPYGIDPVIPTTTTSQQEVWARTGAGAGPVDAMLVGGALRADTTAGAESATVLGGTVSATHWLTARGELAATSYSDGTVTQAGGAVVVPLLPDLTVAGGAQGTWFADLEGTADTGTAGWGEVTVTPGPLTLTGGLRLGREVRPVRLLLPSVWSLDGALGPSGWASVALAVDDRLELQAGYQGAGLEAVTPFGTTSSVVHLGSVGLTWRGGTRARYDSAEEN